MSEDDIIINVTKIKPISKPLPPRAFQAINILPNRYIGIAGKQCEVCNKADTTKCEYCGLYLCSSHQHEGSTDDREKNFTPCYKAKK